MTSVAGTTPGTDYKPTPMPDTPDEMSPADLKALTPQERTRYNLMTREERLPLLASWWGLIPSILPCAGWRQAWAAAAKSAGVVPLARGRKAVLQWMWAVERGVCGALRCPTPHASFGELRKTINTFESGCDAQGARARRGKTCRAPRQKAKRQAQRQAQRQTARRQRRAEVLRDRSPSRVQDIDALKHGA